MKGHTQPWQLGLVIATCLTLRSLPRPNIRHTDLAIIGHGFCDVAVLTLKPTILQNRT